MWTSFKKMKEQKIFIVRGKRKGIEEAKMI
jgi:hypothetical protein